VIRRSPRSPRILFRAPIEYATCEFFLPQFTLNLSAGGIFVLSPTPFPDGEILTVRFRIPELHVSMEILGHVAWSTGAKSRHPSGMGFAFDAVDPDLRAILDQYVNVSAALLGVDPRIGNELPLHIRQELPIPEPEGDDEETAEYLLAPNEYPV
jgi:uncharacterized protein (TIGR02266 family)